MTKDAATLDAEIAIAASILHNKIEHVDYKPSLAKVLTRMAEDHVDNGAVVEFWGTDDDGDEWRVHLDKPQRG